MKKDIKFNSPFEMSQFIETHDTTAACKKYFGSKDAASHKTDRWDWYQTSTFAEADRLFKDGDIDNARRIVAASIAIDNRNAQRTQRRGMSPAVVGCLPNVPAAIQGLPVSMYHRQPQPGRPVVHLDINCSVASFIESHTIIKAGAVILSTVNELERSGHSVEITIKCLSYYESEFITTSVVIKEAGQRFNAAQLAYCLINPSFLRRHLFTVWERTITKKGYFCGYGRICTTGDNILHLQNIAEKIQKGGMTDEEIINTIKAALY